MPDPGGEQPDRFPGPVQLTVKDLRHFRDAGAAQYFHNNRDNGFSRPPQPLFNAPVEPISHAPECIPRCGERKCPGWFSIEAFHCHADQFTRDIDTAPEKGELRYAFADRVAGVCKKFRGDGKELGGWTWLCSQSVGRERG